MRSTSQQYFYHPDHLGSSSFISDASGEAYQFLAYLPPDSYRDGEKWVDQRSSGSYDAPYKFSGKELDAETGYNYFGVRYYDSGLSVWLSVDPLADARSWVSPYSYCQNSPTTRTDPTGALDWIPPSDGSGEWTAEQNDGHWRLHKQAGIPLEDAKNAVIAANQARGQKRTSETMVYPGDKVKVPTGDNTQKKPTSTSGSNLSNATTQSSTSQDPQILYGQCMDVTLATPYGGVAYELGYIYSLDGKILHQYISYGNSTGLEASIGYNYFVIIPKEGFQVSDFQGTSYTYTANYSVFSVAVSGNSYPGYPSDSFMSSYGVLKVGAGFGIGGSVSKTTTIFQNWMPMIDWSTYNFRGGR